MQTEKPDKTEREWYVYNISLLLKSFFFFQLSLKQLKVLPSYVFIY